MPSFIDSHSHITSFASTLTLVSLNYTHSFEEIIKRLVDFKKISPLDALKGVTINAAYQYFEEDKKGSIREGKLADLIILAKNPLKVDPINIKDIKVLQAIKEGEILYSYSI